MVQLPSVEEIVAHLSGVKLTTIVFFLDETFEEVAYDITTSVAEAVEQLAGLIRLQNYQTFTLYEAVRPVNPKLNPEPMPDEHLLLDEHRCVNSLSLKAAKQTHRSPAASSEVHLPRELIVGMLSSLTKLCPHGAGILLTL